MNTTKRIPNTLMHNNKRMVCRIYDAGDACIDRYTIAFKGYHLPRCGFVYPYLACSVNPYHGFGQHGEAVLGEA